LRMQLLLPLLCFLSPASLLAFSIPNANNNNNSIIMKISVSDAFDGGNIEFVEQRVNADDAQVIELVLQVKPDVYTELEKTAHLQYFCFGVSVDLDLDDDEEKQRCKQKVKFVIANAEHTSYCEAWSGFTVFYTDQDVTDADSWKRNVDTFYLGGQLTWEQELDMSSSNSSSSTFYYAFFPPYSYQRHLDFIAKCSTKTNVLVLGQSLGGRDIECIHTGTGDRVAWIIHRQHPGETMAEYYAEGLLTRLLGLNSEGETVDEEVTRLLQLYTFYIIPCMCPDGSVLGHLRTNGVGANLNREWCSKGDYEAPTLERSPEVYCVLQKMDQTGCDLFLDVHGDEEIPYNFISGARHIPNWSQRLESLHGAFVAEYSRSTSDFQRTYGYPPAEGPEQAAKYMNVATNQIGNRFECLAMTLEMPFKDCQSNPDPERGWSPERSRQLGAAVVQPLLYIHPYLRTCEPFWNDLPAEDGYVVMTDDYDNAAHEERDEGFIRLHKRYYSDVHEIHKTQPQN